MGQALRMMQYNHNANERAALSAFDMAGQRLQWYRLDDGVMGGQSLTNHSISDQGWLTFQGMINTNGGGFCSIRTRFDGSTFSASTKGIKIRHRGDGKTYKFLLSDGTPSGPTAKTPSWQADLPTVPGEWRETLIEFDELLPNFGGTRRDPLQVKNNFAFVPGDMREMGVMLSLKRADGTPNPVETFGEGLFPFELQIQSFEPIIPTLQPLTEL